MVDSRVRIIGRGLGGLVAASLLAGVSPDAAAVGSKGAILFETGKTLSNFRFVYANPSGTEQGNPQTFRIIKSCTIQLDPTTPSLVLLNAFRGTSPGTLGYVSTSIGVHDGPQGTPCGRVSEAKGESLELVLGGGLPNGANAFDRLELDLEVKGDVVLRLDVKFDQRIVPYYLTAGAGVAPAGAVNVWKCRDSSDSGPDSGPSDNCRWQVEDLGRSFSITPLQGEFSFEGGGDHPDVLANRTKIFLTEADGIYDCGDTVTSADAAMSCSVTRLNPGATSCVAVPYVFRTSGGRCELTVDPYGQQLVANLSVTYQPEPAAAGTLLSTTWAAAPLSQVKFGTSATTFDIPACRGVTLNYGSQPYGPDPIPETKPDLVPGTPDIEFVCAFERSESFFTEAGQLKTDITEGIQFWGDIAFSRQ